MAEDHFTQVAGQYAVFRPTYPEELFDWLAGIAPQRQCAWDCGAGSGQATLSLAARFERVIATDISKAQLASADMPANVTRRIAPAEASGIADASVDLVTVAQALHWFDLPKFYAEVRRVGKPNAIIAAWGYNHMRISDPELQHRLGRFYRETVGPYWPPERVHVENGYCDLDFPFPRIAAAEFTVHREWTLMQLLGYLRSWSAVARFRAAQKYDPVDVFAKEIGSLWPDGELRRIEWPLFLHVGRIT